MSSVVMSSNVKVRPVGSDDYDGWRNIYIGYAEFYHVEWTEDIVATVWGWVLDSDHQMRCDVAVDENAAIIGFIQYHATPRTLGGHDICYLSDLFVNPDIRSKGVGRVLMDYLIEVCRTEGWPKLRWLTAEDNATARKLYDSYQPRSPFIVYYVDP